MKTKKKGIKKNKRVKGGATGTGKLEQRLTNPSLSRTASLPRTTPYTLEPFPQPQNNPELDLYTKLKDLLDKMKENSMLILNPEEKEIIEKSISILNQRITTSTETSTTL
jgi:hypothetical protein